jgi:MFS family permease
VNKAVLSGVLLITALHAFDELVLVIALPAIANELKAADWYGLIIAVYILASIIGMAWSGKRLDASSPRHMLHVAAAFFGSGLLLALSSQNTAMFLLARTLQGVGGGIGWTLAFGLISLLSPPNEKPKAVAAMDVAWIIPSLLAPLIGGVLVDYLNWRWIFTAQLLPLAVALLLISPRIRHLDKPPLAAVHWQHTLTELLNACRIALGIGLLLFALGRPLGLTWLLLPVAGLCVYKPLQACMPAAWLQLKTPLSASLFSAMMGFMVFYGMEAYQPLYLIDVRGFSTMTAGLVLTAASVSWMCASQMTAHNWLPAALNSYSARLLSSMALLILSVAIFGLLLFDWIGAGWAYAIWCFAGFGMGLGFNTARATAMTHTQKGQEGFVAGAISLSTSLGLSLSSGIGGALRNQVSAQGGTLNDAIALIWVMALLMALLSLALLWRHHLTANQPVVATA